MPGIEPFQIKQVGAAEFLEALQDPRNELSFFLSNYTRVNARWRMLNRRLHDHLIYLVAERSGVGEAGGQSLALLPGTAIWLAPMCCHTFRLSPGETQMDVYHLRFRLRRDGMDLRMPAEVIADADARSLQPQLDRFVDLFRTQLPFRDQRLRASLVLICAALLERQQAARPAGTQFNDRQRKVLMDLVHGHIAERLQPRDLAAALELSADYFSRVFRRTYGMAPRTYLLRERIRIASQRISETQMTIGEVADGLGYPDLQLFSRQFREVMGVNPREFRRRSVAPLPMGPG